MPMSRRGEESESPPVEAASTDPVPLVDAAAVTVVAAAAGAASADDAIAGTDVVVGAADAVARGTDVVVGGAGDVVGGTDVGAAAAAVLSGAVATSGSGLPSSPRSACTSAGTRSSRCG